MLEGWIEGLDVDKGRRRMWLTGSFVCVRLTEGILLTQGDVNGVVIDMSWCMFIRECVCVWKHEGVGGTNTIQLAPIGLEWCGYVEDGVDWLMMVWIG